MSDDADVACELEEIERESGIAAAKKALEQPELRPIGVCHSCEEPVSKPKLFCDSECAKDWQWYQDGIRRRFGRI